MRKNLNKFWEFNEALAPSVFRRYVKSFNKERYADIFKKYQGDRNHYRIYLPLMGDSSFEINSEVYVEVSDFLESKGFTIVDYYEGTCKAPDSKNLSKIGKILNRFIKSDESIKVLLDGFNSDPVRKSGKPEELMVVISRHPYDIAGADTDRKWSNCMTLATGVGSEDLQIKYAKLQSDLLRLKRELTNIQLEIDELDVDIENSLDYDEEDKLRDKVSNLEDDKSRVNHDIDNIEGEISDILERLEHGSNTHYLIHDVREGSLSSFLVKKSDKNINQPLATLNIKPFINENDPDDIILASDKKPYGQFTDAFKETVDNWLNEVNGDRDGVYCLNPKLYDDGVHKIHKITTDSLLNKIKSGDNIDKSLYFEVKKLLNSGDIKPSDIKCYETIYRLLDSGIYDIGEFKLDFDKLSTTYRRRFFNFLKTDKKIEMVKKYGELINHLDRDIIKKSPELISLYLRHNRGDLEYVGRVIGWGVDPSELLDITKFVIIKTGRGIKIYGDVPDDDEYILVDGDDWIYIDGYNGKSLELPKRFNRVVKRKSGSQNSISFGELFDKYKQFISGEGVMKFESFVKNNYRK